MGAMQLIGGNDGLDSANGLRIRSSRGHSNTGATGAVRRSQHLVTLPLVACLLLAGTLLGGCFSRVVPESPVVPATDRPSKKEISQEIDSPMQIDVSRVTYSRHREEIPVKVEVTNPDFVYPFAQRTVGSVHVGGTSTIRMKFGEALKAASPLVWNKYLDVRIDGTEKLPAVQMEVTDVSGEGTLDFSGEGTVTDRLSLTLRCRLVDSDGQALARFSSTKACSVRGAPVASGATEFGRSTQNLLPDAFNEILGEFFSDTRVLAALAKSAEEHRLAHRPGKAPASAAPAVRPIRKAFAVVVGIAKYQRAGKAGLTNLVYADDDAKAFAATLKKQGWSDSHIKVLLNEQATQRNILIALESWLTKAGPDDLIVLFWSGHGFPDPADPQKVYFACYDTDISIPATGYRMDRVRGTLEERRARNVVVLADTCHAGKLITRGNGEGAKGVRPYLAKLQKDKKIPRGWIFMVAAEADRKAVEHSAWSNGAFTHCLLEALGGKADGYQGVGKKDGVVTMLELRTYLSSEMPEKTQKVLGVAKRPIITTSTGDSTIWNLDLIRKIGAWVHDFSWP